jgi:hypothetical protein
VHDVITGGHGWFTSFMSAGGTPSLVGRKAYVAFVVDAYSRWIMAGALHPR